MLIAILRALSIVAASWAVLHLRGPVLVVAAAWTTLGVLAVVLVTLTARDLWEWAKALAAVVLRGVTRMC